MAGPSLIEGWAGPSEGADVTGYPVGYPGAQAAGAAFDEGCPVPHRPREGAWRFGTTTACSSAAIGSPRRGRETIGVISPSTEEVIARVPEGTEADIDKAVAAARTAFDRGPVARA